jgi:hypothetical protein
MAAAGGGGGVGLGYFRTPDSLEPFEMKDPSERRLLSGLFVVLRFSPAPFLEDSSLSSIQPIGENPAGN